MNDEQHLYIKCDCGGDLLELERYVEESPSDRGFQIAFWDYGQWGRAPMSWKQRIRWCWNVLKTGCPWSDMVMINDEKALEISNFILKNIKPKVTKPEEKVSVI